MSQPQQMTIQEALDLAIQHHQAGRLAEACAIYQQILKAQPNQSDALHLAGVAAHQAGHNEQAIALIARAVALQPGAANYHFHLGQVLSAVNRNAEAIRAFHKALEIQPDFFEAQFFLGLAHRRLGNLNDAMNCFGAVTQQRPDVPEAWNNLAESLQASGHLDQAIEAFQRAIQLRPDYAEAHNNLGNALNEIGRFDLAVDSLNEAIQLRPDYAAAHYNLGVNQLLRGDLERGWPEFEWRLLAPENSQFRQDFTQPQWKGPSQDISGRRILLHAEQGLGDAIQFVRYIPMLRSLGEKIILQCEPELVALFQQLKDVERVIARGEALPAFDLHCPLLSLAHCFGTTIQNIPAQVPYLNADPDKSERWKRRLANINGRKIGLAWGGRPQHPRDRARSLSLPALSPLAQVSGAHFFSLQKGEANKQAANPPAGMTLSDWTADLHDLDDTAGLIDHLDLIISVDTSVAHLAGAMGKPVWVLLPHVPDWRWMLDRDDSPWYPTMKLFRQPLAGDWNTPIQRMIGLLR